MAIQRQIDLFSSVSVTFNHHGQFMNFEFRDGVTLQNLNNTFIELMQHRNFQHNMDACYDFSRAYPELTMPEIEQHAQFVSEHSHLRGGSYKLAMVASDTLSSALLSIYKLLIVKSSVEAQVFSNKIDAVNWLLEKD